MNKAEWLNPVTRTYAEHYADAEGARTEFLRWRNDTLGVLERRLVAEVAKQGMSVISTVRKSKEVEGWVDFSLMGRYQSAHSGQQNSGLAIYLDSDHGGPSPAIAFRANAWFQVSYDTFQSMGIQRPPDDVVDGASGGMLINHNGTYIYFLLALVRLDSDRFTEEDLLEETAEAARAFKRVDNWFTNTYQAVKSAQP